MATFDPNKPPKGFPKDGLMRQHGKPYITHVGLVWLANNRGKPWSGTIVSQDIRWNQNGHPHAAVVVYKVWDDEQEHTDIGDACAANVGKMIAPHLIRMASTRAQNRALRAFVGYAGCTADELTLGESYEGTQGHDKGSAQTSSRRQPAAVKKQPPEVSPSRPEFQDDTRPCPACGGRTVDNRNRAVPARDKGVRLPYWFCSRGRACPGDKGDYAWAEFDDLTWGDKKPAEVNHG